MTDESSGQSSSPEDPEREERTPQWPEEGEEGFEEWLSGPRPAEGAGRGAWLAARSKRVRELRKEQGDATTPQEERDGSSRTVEPSAPQENPALVRLRHEAENAPLPADRIRAAEALLRAERAESEHVTDEVALWNARREALDLLPPQERLEWLLGVMREEGEGGDTQQLEAPEGWADDDIVPPEGGGTPARR